MIYEEVGGSFGKEDMIRSLSDGVVRKYSGYVTHTGDMCDSFNKDLVVYRNGVLAEVVKKGNYVDPMLEHIQNVRDTCKRLGCTPSELLHKDYTKELGNKK